MIPRSQSATLSPGSNAIEPAPRVSTPAPYLKVALVLLAALATKSLHCQQLTAYVQAQQAFSAKNYRQAAGLFAAAASETSNTPQIHADALLMQAKSLVNVNDFRAADPVLRTCISLDPKSSEILYLFGYVLQRENQPRESLAVFTKAAAIKPPTPKDLEIVALNYVLLEDYADAVRWLDRSLAADPRNAEAWYYLGRAHMQQGNFVQAEQNFHRTLALTPLDPKALDNLGLALEAQNRTDEALSAYKQAIAAQTGTLRATEQPLLNLGTLLNSRNRSPEAIEPLKSATAISPRCPRCHEELARAYLATGQQASGAREMEQAVALDPANPRLHYQLGQIYRRAGMADKADAELKISAGLYGAHSTQTDR